MPQRLDAATKDLVTTEQRHRAATRDALNVEPRVEMNPELFFPRRMFDGDLLPPVPIPPQFRREPMAVGTQMGRAIDSLLKIAPQLRGQLPAITPGPTAASMREMVRSDMAPDRFEGTTLMGVTDKSDAHYNEIGINPSLLRPSSPTRDLEQTLVHEAKHVVGGGEGAAEAAEATTPHFLPWSPIVAFLQKVGVR